MWTERGLVENAIAELGLALAAVPDDEAARRYAALEAAFSTVPRATWIWEHLKGPHHSLRTPRGFELLPALVSDPALELLFFPGSDQAMCCAFRGRIDAIVAAIGACPAFEYCIAPLSATWLIGESHHDVVYAVGEPVASRLAGM